MATILEAVRSVFADPAADVFPGTAPLTVKVLPVGEPAESYLRGAHELPALYLRCEGIESGDSDLEGLQTLNVQVGCHYFERSGHDQREAEGRAWDVLIAAMQAAGEEFRRPGGATGAGTGLFGLGTGRSRATRVLQEGSIDVAPLESPGDSDAEARDVIHGWYKFGIEYRLDLTGGTT